MRKRTISQLMAINYATTERAREKRRKFIIEREGSLDAFKASNYKTEYWYIRAKYNKRIYADGRLWEC